MPRRAAGASGFVPLTSDTRTLLQSLYTAGVEAADPYAATRSALEAMTFGARVWIIAAGKAARPMARGALDSLAEAHRTPSGGVVVAPDGDGERMGPLHSVAGSHPVPDARSFHAADAVGRAADLVRPGDEVLVLLSGGATSLIAAPVAGVTRDSLSLLFRELIGSGAPIDTINAVRKRVLRWGAGRLAVALSGARVSCLVASDVIGDDLASIGSGPCVPDPLDASRLAVLIDRAGLWPSIPSDVRDLIEATDAGDRPETPKPGHPAFDAVTSRIVLGNANALDGIASAATSHGIVNVNVAATPIRGDARSTGDAIAHTAIGWADGLRSSLGGGARACALWGGETTVRLTPSHQRPGGRCQELALACAAVLSGREGVTILAAGTDGRDGPTDAAGAIVDGTTWERIRATGRNPARDLDDHDSYAALDAAGVLLRTGLTATNVNDVVIAMVEGAERAE